MAAKPPGSFLGSPPPEDGSSILKGSASPPSKPLTIADMFAISAAASKSKSSPVGASADAAVNGSPLI